MNIKKLKEIINLIPEDAKIYVEADHGQQSEIAHNILFCIDDCGYQRLPYYGEDLDWCQQVEIEDFTEVIAVLITV